MGRHSAIIVLLMLVLIFQSHCRLLDTHNRDERKMGVRAEYNTEIEKRNTEEVEDYGGGHSSPAPGRGN
ncbi:hypothetical protein SUGI_0362700 [Cryptomeria japonica]|nr:hypothetical protein SUGI_0362630 [Cryptomeria japonica]GLJ19998.1 hypothetical protein SUGI_0362650 [Cryptomeria japonica]GLJ20002.1 hypothetical protein SUGI_0362700 [Cryptomeria japonica]